MVKQADVVGLLTVGSKSAPIEGVLGRGEEGSKQLVEVARGGEERGVVALFEKDRGTIGRVLGAGGLPPMPVPIGGTGKIGKAYVMDQDRSEGFPEE